MATQESNGSIFEEVKSSYSTLKGKVFSGIFEDTVKLHDSRKVIRVNESEKKMIKDLTSILDMDDGDREMIWKAITQYTYNGIYGTRLWCNVKSKTKPGRLSWQNYRIINCSVKRGHFDKGYEAIVDVHVVCTS